MLLVLAAPVSCSAIRKSEACLTPGARLFGIGITVGRPAPAHSATWSKPSAKAASIVIVPPKRTPPYIANWPRRSSSRRTIFRKFLSQRTVMPYSATPPKPAMTRSSSLSTRACDIADRAERVAAAVGHHAGDLGRQRLDLEPVDRGDEMAVVDQVVREGEAGRTKPDDEHLIAARRLRQRPPDIERVPPGQQRVDLEPPGQRRARP